MIKGIYYSTNTVNQNYKNVNTEPAFKGVAIGIKNVPGDVKKVSKSTIDLISKVADRLVSGENYLEKHIGDGVMFSIVSLKDTNGRITTSFKDQSKVIIENSDLFSVLHINLENKANNLSEKISIAYKSEKNGLYEQGEILNYKGIARNVWDRDKINEILTKEKLHYIDTILDKILPYSLK